MLFNSAKSLGWIFWEIKYCFKAQNAKFDQQIKNHFSAKIREIYIV